MKPLANLFILPLSLLCCLILPEFTGGSAVARSYYVSNQGHDANDGQSPASPWKTIAKVNTFAFTPGDNVFFERGNVWREELQPKASGLPGNPITFSSYGAGDRPVIYGADLASGWNEYNNNVYYKSGYSYEVNLALFDGYLGNRQTALSAVDSDKDWYWEDVSDRLYIYSAGNPDTLYHSPGIEVGGARRSGIKLYYESTNQQYLTFKDFSIRYANDSGMNFQGVNYLTIDNCTVESSGIKNIYTFDTDNFTLKNSSSFNALREHGLYISAGKDQNPAGDTSNYISIENSQFYANKLNGIQINPNDGPALNYVTIYGCKIYDNYNHGILDMGSNGSNYSYNLIYDNGIGFNGTQIFLHYNELYYPNGEITTSNAQVYNNVIGAISRPTAYGVKISEYVKNSVIKNNIFYWPNGVNRAVVVEPVATESTGLDYNLYYIPNSANSNFSWGNYWRKTLPEWQTVTGQDSHSLSANPAFVNAEGFDFHLSTASPCVDAGIDIGLTWDYEKFAVPYGGAVDMGALEFHETDLDQVLGYSYKYTFTNGDYYQGVVYAKRDYGYDIGYSKNISDEHDLPGNYLITDIVASKNNFSKDGQVFVSTYYDAESKKTYAPLNSASVAGSQHLQSESGYIIKAGIADFAFGKGYWEADLGACYNFTYRYGNGDYYQGQVYASQDYGYYPGWKKQVANETGYVGYYEINSLSYIEDVSYYGQLVINKYYDKETRKKYSIINFSGNNYLGSESGYIISANLGSHFFGYGFYEADKK